MKTPLSFTTIATALTLSGGPAAARGPQVVETDSTITVTVDDRPVLTYHKASVPPPPGAPAAFARSGFIHPLHAPSGGVVTSIHAPDHIHHMGLWHAWVNTERAGQEVDFWNLKEEQGTVRYHETLRLIQEPETAGFIVSQQHVQLAKDSAASGEVVLEEVFSIRFRKVGDTYVLDHETRQTNVTPYPLHLPAYRYGGTIAYRAPLDWDKDNSDYLTSEGLNRERGHATRAKWCAMYGPTGHGVATVTILCHPDNHDFPQRMRLWPDGRVFFNYVPIQEHAWALEPGVESVMRYRIIIADGHPDALVLEEAWRAYAAP